MIFSFRYQWTHLDFTRSEEEAARIDKLAEEVGTIQSMKNSFNPILTVILSALDAPPVFMRTKALRALGQIVTSDPSILSAVSIWILVVFKS
jgi:cohesin loading factor subunit SCC2